MKDGKSERQVTYEGRLVGDQLRLSTRRRSDAAVIELTAHRAASGEGAMPARLPLPTLHKVSDNGLVKTPPMGWNRDRKSTRLNSSHLVISYAVFCLKKKNDF